MLRTRPGARARRPGRPSHRRRSLLGALAGRRVRGRVPRRHKQDLAACRPEPRDRRSSTRLNRAGLSERRGACHARAPGRAGRAREHGCAAHEQNERRRRRAEVLDPERDVVRVDCRYPTFRQALALLASAGSVSRVFPAPSTPTDPARSPSSSVNRSSIKRPAKSASAKYRTRTGHPERRTVP